MLINLVCGGMYSSSANCANDWDLLWINLEKKLALLGRVPHDCRSPPGDCFFASIEHALYKNSDAHFKVRTAGVTHLSNNPSLYIESIVHMSWDSYIQEMSKPGTWCDNVIMQAVANALSCTIHITDSSSNGNATIITPVKLPQVQKTVFLGYINNKHYVSTLLGSNYEINSKRKKLLQKEGTCSKKQLTNEVYLANSVSTTDWDLIWINLEKKLALLGRVAHDCRSPPGDCFFASIGHALYKNSDAHFEVRTAGVTHLINNPSLYIESIVHMSWDSYIQEMSKPGTWCDNVIMQAVANALSCTIHITDSSSNGNATIITPVKLPQRPKIVSC